MEAAVTDLGLGNEWIGKGNRENQTLPVLDLRESATSMGLLRKRHGMLLLTSRVRALRTDPVAPWWHLAERMPPKSPDRCENQAGLILLTVLAAPAAGDPDVALSRRRTAMVFHDAWPAARSVSSVPSPLAQPIAVSRRATIRYARLAGRWRLRPGLVPVGSDRARRLIAATPE